MFLGAPTLLAIAQRPASWLVLPFFPRVLILQAIRTLTPSTDSYTGTRFCNLRSARKTLYKFQLPSELIFPDLITPWRYFFIRIPPFRRLVRIGSSTVL